MPRRRSASTRSVRLIAAACAALLAAPLQAETLPRPDGSDITYHLSGAGPGKPRALLLMLQGSGCDPVADRPWLRSEPAVLAPGHAVLAIEKYGVTSGARPDGLVEGCTPAFWARNTLQQRVLDVVQVVASLRSQPWWNGELVVQGGSEGGAVAALAAPLLPEARAVVIVSSGIGVSVADLIRAAVPPPVAAQIGEVIDAARLNPTGDKRFGGASYRWWADAADINPARALLQSDVPVLLIQGARDRFAPVATARAARDLFAAAGKRNLTYWEYPDYDHFMKDQAGVDHREAVLRRAANWLKALSKSSPERGGGSPNG